VGVAVEMITVPKRLGFVGVGTMGTPMAEHLLRGGFEVIVHDLVPERLEALAARGAKVMPSPAAVARESESVICMLPMPQDTERVVFGVDGLVHGLRPGSTVIDMSTNSPAFARRAFTELTARGFDFLEAPVSLGEKGARSGTLTIMVAGSPATFERHQRVFQAMATRVYFLEVVGCAQLAKLVSNFVSIVAIGSVAEALVLGTKGGVKPDLMYDILENSIADSRVLRNIGPKILAGDFSPTFALDLAFKDLDLALECGREYGVPLPLTAACRELFGFARAAGRGDLDCRAVITTLEDVCRVTVRSRPDGGGAR
jgi:3-hydroxyisobutyrate dehydrogenase-like beta-hydroxyacid dehydrogenase